MSKSDTQNEADQQPLTSISRQRLADQIADVLREQMLTGVLAPGTPLHERDMSSALGVSRTPLREAILILEAEGLVDTSPARSPRVVNPSERELKELLFVQGALEAIAGELACKNATDDEIKKIRALHENMLETSELGDPVTFFKTDMEFHESIVRCSQNRALIKTHKQYNTRLWRARFMSSSRKLRRAKSMDQHHEILVALEERDPTKVALSLRQHLEHASLYLPTLIEAGDTPDPEKG